MASPHPRLRPDGLIWGYQDITPPGWCWRGFRHSLRSRRNGVDNQPIKGFWRGGFAAPPKPTPFLHWHPAPFRRPSGWRNLLFSAASPVVAFRTHRPCRGRLRQAQVPRWLSLSKPRGLIWGYQDITPPGWTIFTQSTEIWYRRDVS